MPTSSGGSDFAVGDRVMHYESRWAGPVIAIDDSGVTVRPDHPRPKEVLQGGRFVPTPPDWEGWAPITVQPDELEAL